MGCGRCFTLRHRLGFGGRGKTRNELNGRLIVRAFLRCRCRRRCWIVVQFDSSVVVGSSVRRARRHRWNRSIALRLDAEMERRLGIALHVIGHHLFQIRFRCRLKECLEEFRIDRCRRRRRRRRCRCEREVRCFFLIEMEKIGQLFGQDSLLIIDLQPTRGNFHSKGRSEIESGSFEESKDEFHVLSRSDVFLQFRVQHQTNLNPLQIRGESGASLATTEKERRSISAREKGKGRNLRVNPC